MPRTPLVAGNWKMNLDHLEAIQLVQQLGYRLREQDLDGVEVAVIPPFTALRSVQTLIEGDRLGFALGAQDCHWEESGAYTGAVSPTMLSALHATYVLCGHSERRQLFGDDDAVVHRKVTSTLAHGLTPILCVGETEQQRDDGRAEDVVRTQLRAGTEGFTAEQVAQLVVAYEPVWAIGTGRTATDEQAAGMCAFVRGVLTDVADRAGQQTRVLYGGSVKPGNARGLFTADDIDGGLVGGASLEADDFAAIVRAARG